MTSKHADELCLRGKIGVQVKTRRYDDSTHINWKYRRLKEMCEFIDAQPFFAYVRTPVPDDQKRQSLVEFFFCSYTDALEYSTGDSKITKMFQPSKASDCIIHKEPVPKVIFRNMTRQALGSFGEWYVANYFRLRYKYKVRLAPSESQPGIDLIIIAK